MRPTAEMERLGGDLYWCNGQCWRPFPLVDLAGVTTTAWQTVPDEELWEEVFTLTDPDCVTPSECEEMCSGEVDLLNADSFDRVWGLLAGFAKCDELGGAEYRRVRSEWIAAGRPVPMSGFILAAANRRPRGDRGPLAGVGVNLPAKEGVIHEA